MIRVLTRIKNGLGVSAAVTALVSASMFFGASSPVGASAWSNNCWYYIGGDKTTGGCAGNVAGGGSYFQVHEWCGWMSLEESSPITFAPPGVARNATTSACPWYSEGIRQAIVNSW